MQQPLFRIRELSDGQPGASFFWIESTAPLQVDGDPPGAPSTTALKELPDATAITDVAKRIVEQPRPHVVIRIHGFNNPLGVVLNRLAEALRFIRANEPEIAQDTNLFCMGYRWPSEHAPLEDANIVASMPPLLRILFRVWWVVLLVGVLIWLTGALNASGWHAWGLSIGRVGILLAALVGAIPFVVSILRKIVYFRDNYRATQYAVPDLVEVVRRLDHEIIRLNPELQNRVRLSFIGHSMGALVTTSVIRILSDVFSKESISHNPDPYVGQAFRLENLVLVSPDIPAEALMTQRANFLLSSLRRFPSAYLFSNEGDVVLSMVSTLGNYFFFPAKDRRHGMRLGNTAVDSNGAGVFQPPADKFLSTLRVGELTMEQLDQTTSTSVSRMKGLTTDELHQTLEHHMATCFTYFDCTDYAEPQPQGPPKRFLTLPGMRRPIQGFPAFKLLLHYFKGTPDVHSGYFDGPTTQSLLYRAACLDRSSLITQDLDATCKAVGIRVLLPPAPPPSLELAAAAGIGGLVGAAAGSDPGSTLP